MKRHSRYPNKWFQIGKGWSTNESPYAHKKDSFIVVLAVPWENTFLASLRSTANAIVS